MAHSPNGKLRGRAAVTQRAEERQEFIGQAVNLDIIRERLKQKERDAIARCVAIEGKMSFYAWYTPTDGSISKRVELIEERISSFLPKQMEITSAVPAS